MWRPVVQSTAIQTTLTQTMRQNATRTPGDSARFTRVELSENATTMPATASTPTARALTPGPRRPRRTAVGTGGQGSPKPALPATRGRQPVMR